MKRFLGAARVSAMVAVMTLCAIPSEPASAETDPWCADNHTRFSVRVFWTAAGCTKIASHCDNPDRKVFTVCKEVDMEPDEKTSFRFEDATTDRKKQVCALNQGNMSSILRTTSDRKKCSIRHNDADGAPEWHDK